MSEVENKYIPLDIKINAKLYPEVAVIFHRIEMYLRDIHAMFLTPQSQLGMDSGCNYSIALTLFAVIGGLSRTIYPISTPGGDQGAFTTFVRDLFTPYWNHQDWIKLDEAADILYKHLRNPLIHDLGTNTPRQDAKLGRRTLLPVEIDVVKWGGYPSEDIVEIEKLEKWPTNISFINRPSKNERKIEVSLSGIYWITRKIVEDISEDERIIKMAESWHTFWSIHQSYVPISDLKDYFSKQIAQFENFIKKIIEERIENPDISDEERQFLKELDLDSLKISDN